MQRILFIITFLFCLSFNNLAQYRFDSWTTENGLPQNSVYDLANTPDDYLWLTTLDGLVRFDGVRFTVFNKGNSQGIISNRFTNLFVETDGTLWIGTEESGLVRYRNGQFQVFTTADGLVSNQIPQIQKDLDNSLLILGSTGLTRFRDEKFTIERQIDFRNFKIYIAPSGARWEIDENGLRVSRGSIEEKFALPFDLDSIQPDRTFNYIAFIPMLEDRDGALWFAASGSLYHLKNGAIETFDASSGMPSSRVRQLVQDRAGAIWLATEKNGVCRLAQNRFACFGKNEGLSSNIVMSLLVDREGTLWVGTDDGGINRVTPRVVASVSVAEGLLDKNTCPILETAAGDIWIGTTSALSHFKDGKITNYTRRNGLFYEIVQSLFEDSEGRLWIGGIGGVQYLKDGKFYDFTEKLGIKIGDYNFLDIHEDQNGTFWFATQKGLIRYSGGEAKIFTTADGLPGDDVKVIHEARNGSLWFGCSGGIAVLSPDFSRQMLDNQESRLKAELKTFTEQDGLAGNNVRAIYEDDDGAFWIGTYESGLSRFKDGKFTNFSTKNGLYSNGVFQILPDERGNFWMSSNQGIYRLARQQLNDLADGKIASITSTFFGKSDGMLNIECNGGRSPAGIKTRDGRLWFPTQDGVAIIDPKAVAFNPLPPPVVIETIKIDSIEQSAIQNPPSKIQIAPNQRNLEIAYTGLSFIKPEQVRFRYRLEGLTEDWTDAGGRRTAFYPYLPPGKYTFRVIAANSDNVWNEQGASIEIVVHPAFYRTWWFIVLATLAIAAVAYFLFKRRIVKLERERFVQQTFTRQLIASQEQERKRIAAELHDSLGQRLVVIKNLALMFLNARNGETDETRQIEEISAEASNAIGEVKVISYNLRPYQLDRIGLTKAVEAIIRTAQAASAIDFTAEIDDIDDYFPKDSEINFYRIVQECVNNIIKHSEATTANIKIETNERQLKLIIADNGQGFRPADEGLSNPPSAVRRPQSKGFGLIGIAERAELLGGKVEIKSAPAHGTVIKIRLVNLKS